MYFTKLSMLFIKRQFIFNSKAAKELIMSLYVESAKNVIFYNLIDTFCKNGLY